MKEYIRLWSRAAGDVSYWTVLDSFDNLNDAFDEVESPLEPLPEQSIVAIKRFSNNEILKLCIVIEGQAKQIPKFGKFVSSWLIYPPHFSKYKDSVNWIEFWSLLSSQDKMTAAISANLKFSEFVNFCFALLTVAGRRLKTSESVSKMVSAAENSMRKNGDCKDHLKTIASIEDPMMQTARDFLFDFVRGCYHEDRAKLNLCAYGLFHEITYEERCEVVYEYLPLAKVLTNVAEDFTREY